MINIFFVKIDFELTYILRAMTELLRGFRAPTGHRTAASIFGQFCQITLTHNMLKTKSTISQFTIFIQLISFKTIELNRVSIFFHENFSIIVKFGGQILKNDGQISEFGHQISEFFKKPP